MIELKASLRGSLLASNYSCDKAGLAIVSDSATEPTVPSSSSMDSDWYYRWLLFSHYQRQDWQQKTLSSSSTSQHTLQSDMTLAKSGTACICGFCERMGLSVKQTPDTVSRILQALNLNKLPLAKPRLDERLGLCDECEHQIKLLEEAANIRNSLTESFLSNLKHLSKSAGRWEAEGGWTVEGWQWRVGSGGRSVEAGWAVGKVLVAERR